MARLYTVFTLAILLIFAYTSWSGLTLGTLLSSGAWKPGGKSVYHK